MNTQGPGSAQGYRTQEQSNKFLNFGIFFIFIFIFIFIFFYFYFFLFLFLFLLFYFRKNRHHPIFDMQILSSSQKICFVQQ